MAAKPDAGGLGDAIEADGRERCSLVLRRALGSAEDVRRGGVKQAASEAERVYAVQEIEPTCDMRFMAALIGEQRIRRARFGRAVVRTEIVDLVRFEFGNARMHLRAVKNIDRRARAGPRTDEPLPADADDVIATGAKQLRKVMPILSGTADDQRDLGNALTPMLGSLGAREIQ